MLFPARPNIVVFSLGHGCFPLVRPHPQVNLPGGVQRRRTHEDQLQMRDLYVEGDLISAEVQQFYGDGALSLHTRSLKCVRA